MGLTADLRTLYHLAIKPVRGATHGERLEAFYRGQARDYDAFRRRLLPGREQLWRRIECQPGGVWVDMGGGTAENVEHLGARLASLRKLYVVDLSPSLIEIARRRVRRHRWDNVVLFVGDATTFRPPEGQVDVVTFSYSLTMIPDWFGALEQAARILKPGGRIGVVDFYVGRKHPAPGLAKHGWATRTMWPVWFALDDVRVSADHLPYLLSHFDTCWLSEGRTRVPYLPGRAPYYLFLGEAGAARFNSPTTRPLLSRHIDPSIS